MSRLEEYVQSLPKWKQIFHGKYRTELVTRVSEVLKEKGWSQSDLADVLECSDAYVSKLLSGNANVTLKTVSKLESALGEDIMHIAWSFTSDHESDVLPKVWEVPVSDEDLEEHEWSQSEEEVEVHHGQKGSGVSTVSIDQIGEISLSRENSLEKKHHINFS